MGLYLFTRCNSLTVFIRVFLSVPINKIVVKMLKIVFLLPGILRLMVGTWLLEDLQPLKVGKDVKRGSIKLLPAIRSNVKKNISTGELVL